MRKKSLICDGCLELEHRKAYLYGRVLLKISSDEGLIIQTALRDCTMRTLKLVPPPLTNASRLATNSVLKELELP